MEAKHPTPPLDEYISFKETSHKNPYECPIMLEVEDIFGKKLTYDRPFSKQDIRYIVIKRKYLHKNKCRNCFRLPENRTQQPIELRLEKATKYMDRLASKEKRAPVYYTIYNREYLTCDGCRVMKLKQSINREIRSILCTFRCPGGIFKIVRT